jgi:hypothetical protein
VAKRAWDQHGFFRTPRGLGLATDTTSAAFFPHLEQRIRSVRSFSITFQLTRPECLGLDLAARAAATDDPHT